MKLFSVVLVAVLLNISGAIIGKYIALADEWFYDIISLGVLLICVYIGRMQFWTYVSRIYQLSYIYPFLSINYLASFGLGMLLFSESFSWEKLIGSLIIGSGVLVISMSKYKVEETR